MKDRREDIPLLVDHFIELLATRAGRPAPEPGPETLRRLYDYDYPGNVRELKNILERAIVLCSSGSIDPRCLPPEVQGTPRRRKADAPEVRDLKDALSAHGWNRSRTARALGIGRTTLWRRMKDAGLA